MLVSVVVPVFNSESSLPGLCERVRRALEPAQRLGELIFVDDGSGDGSWHIVQELAAAHSWIRGISLMRNFGQHNALLCGIRMARHPVIVTLDDDLQTPPEEIPKLLDQLDQGNDVVYGTPQTRDHGFFRDVASMVTKLALQATMGSATARKVSAFRAFRTRLRDAFSEYSGPFVSIDVLLSWGGSRFAAVPVRHERRRVGKSNYTLGKLIAHAMNMMTGFSTAPLQLASITGFVFTVFGLGVLVYVVGRYLIQGGSVPGFPFLASVIAIFSGAQLFALGIFGEYLARMHFRMMNRPPYAISELTSLHAGQGPREIRLSATGFMPETAARGARNPGDHGG